MVRADFIQIMLGISVDIVVISYVEHKLSHAQSLRKTLVLWNRAKKMVNCLLKTFRFLPTKRNMTIVNGFFSPEHSEKPCSPLI